MEARIYNYECKHSQVDGHRMLFAWPHGIEMLIDFTIGKGYILNRGDMKAQFELIDFFDTIIIFNDITNSLLTTLIRRHKPSRVMLNVFTLWSFNAI